MRTMTLMCVVAGALVVAAFGGVALAQPEKNPVVLLAPKDLPKKIAEAKTAADHEAIAATYAQLARQTEERIKDHQSMAAAYSGPGDTKYLAVMGSHCSQIIRELSGEATDYRKLAQEHEDLAKQAAKK